MKDKEARDRLDTVEALLDSLRTPNLESVSIKNCPKCEHPVLALSLNDPYSGVANGRFWTATYPLENFKYQCLTCGSKFICENECVCKLVEESK